MATFEFVVQILISFSVAAVSIAYRYNGSHPGVWEYPLSFLSPDYFMRKIHVWGLYVAVGLLIVLAVLNGPFWTFLGITVIWSAGAQLAAFYLDKSQLKNAVRARQQREMAARVLDPDGIVGAVIEREKAEEKEKARQSADHELTAKVKIAFEQALAKKPWHKSIKSKISTLHRDFAEYTQQDFGSLSPGEIAEIAIDNISRQVKRFFPSVDRIVLGGEKTWDAYAAEFWDQFDDEVAYDNWYTKSWNMGRAFQRELGRIPITVLLPEKLRTQGHMIMAAPGHGKTVCMENMILDDLHLDAAIVVIDSQESLIPKLLRVVPQDRLVYLDGGSLSFPLALAPFDIGRTDRDEDQVKIARSLDLFENMFAASGTELNELQSLMFQKLARLLIEIPNATMLTALEIVRDGYERYEQHLRKLSDIDQVYIAANLAAPSHKRDAQPNKPTRNALELRLNNLLKSEGIARMFNAPEGKVDIAREIKDRKVILINTSQRNLAPSGASLFGRYCLMQIIMDVLARSETHNPAERVYLYIDEAQEYFATGALLQLMFEQGRKRGLCPVLAFQDFAQLRAVDTQLASTVRSMTAIKYTGSVTAEDKSVLARDADADPNMYNVPELTFTATLRGVGTSHIKFEVGVLEAAAVRTAADVETVKKSMHAAYSYDFQREKIREKPDGNLYGTGLDPDAPQRLD